MRLFSTNNCHRDDKAASDDYDLVEDEIKASIERKHQQSLYTKEGRSDAAKTTARQAARAQRKERASNESHNAVHAKKKPHPLQDLLADIVPSAEEPRESTSAHNAPGLEHLTARLADLEERLATARARSWDEAYKHAQEETSLKTLHNIKNMSKSAKKRQYKLGRERFATRVAEIKKDKREHQASVAELEASVEKLKLFVASKTAGDQEPSKDGAELPEGLGSEQKKRLEEIKRRKEELLRKQDELAVKMAKLRAAKLRSSPTPMTKPASAAPKETDGSFQTTKSTANAQTQKPRDSSPFADLLSNKPSDLAPLQTQSLRLHIPGGKLRIDDDLTVDINAPVASLRSQISALQNRLKLFHPRLDDLPYNVNKKDGSSRNDQYILKTWVKILVSRFQAKTGIQGSWTAADEQLQRVLGQNVINQGLSEEAAERMAKRWNDVFAEKRGCWMPVSETQQVEERDKEDEMKDDYDAMGFLQDEYEQEDEQLVAQDEPSQTAQEFPAQTQSSALVSGKDTSNDFDLSDKEFKDFVNAFGKEGEAKAPSEQTIPSPQTQTQQQVSDVNMNAQRTVTMWTTGEVLPVPSSRPSPDTPEFEAWALQRLQNPSNEPHQSKKDALRVLERNLEAVELGHGHEDDKAAAKGIPTRAVPYRRPKPTYPYLKSFDPRAPSVLEQMKARGPLPKWAQEREYSTTSRAPLNQTPTPSPSQQENPTSQQQLQPQPHLPHLTPSGSAHMVSITAKAPTSRTAIAVGTVYFSNPTPLSLITANALKKGDVLSVSRIAGIMAAKKCPDIVPLCHPITLTHVGVELRTFDADGRPTNGGVGGGAHPDNMAHGGVQIECRVACTGATGVEMEALTAVMGAALSVVDMCKAVDKFQRIGDVRVVRKEGGRSGGWNEDGWRSWVDV